MSLLYVTHERFYDHDPGATHPERATRLTAAKNGLDDSGVPVVHIAAEQASEEAVLAVHDVGVLDRLRELHRRGGGVIDPDTTLSSGSLPAALIAAGSGLTAIRYIDQGMAARAFCAVRPPGHHATPAQSMGFCLLNTIAITARALQRRGERVAIVDIDAHHGNGTQDSFYADGDVVFASLHQWPFYPGTGSLEQTGVGEGFAATRNLPMPAGATGDVYQSAIERVILPTIDRLNPTWVLLSIGFDAHRDDPLTALGLTSGDYANIIDDIVRAFPAAKIVGFLEGGYNLDAVRRGVHATLTALAGDPERPEPSSRGGGGRDVVELAAQQSDALFARADDEAGR